MEVNKYTLSDLRKMTKIMKAINVNEEVEFDYLRIISNNKFREIEKEKKNILFFPITIDQTVVDEGWVSKTTNLRDSFLSYMERFPDYTFVLEEDMLKEGISVNAKIIVVPNIMKAVDDLYDYIIRTNKFEVVAVTGSAGKTTTVGIIETVLSKKYSVLRIYSDRITPILLKAYIINLLNSSHDVIALEMSIYYKHHVKALADLLHPTISAIPNIGTAHLGIGGLNSIDDICINKARIFEYATTGIVNADDCFLQRLKVADHKLYYDTMPIFDTDLEELKTVSPRNAKIDLENSKLFLDGLMVNVPIFTYLTLTSFLFAYEIGKTLGISTEDIVEALNSFKCVENRLQRDRIFGVEVIFDGDSSFKERIHQLSLHLYSKAYLVIRKYGTNVYIDDFAGIKEYFNKFDRVYLFDDIDYLDELRDAPNVTVVNNHDFIGNLDGAIFYHYHDYFYKYKVIKEENLL